MKHLSDPQGGSQYRDMTVALVALAQQNERCALWARYDLQRFYSLEPVIHSEYQQRLAAKLQPYRDALPVVAHEIDRREAQHTAFLTGHPDELLPLPARRSR